MTDVTISQGSGERTIDQSWFRTVLGQYPTGVCVITADDPETGLAGMVVGTLTSVSLDPPLVAFFPDKGSSTWPKIERAGRFCVNILGADQDDVCRRFASRGGNKFEGQAYRLAGTGSPIIEGTVAWIDCEIESVSSAGDHYYVLGRVQDLQLEQPRLPLLFFQGGYGRFSPLSLVAPDARGQLTQQLRQVDLIRGEMEHLASDLGCQVSAGAQIGDEVIIVATAGSGDERDDGTLVGQSLPFVPPSGAIFAAWRDEAEINDWLKLRSAPSTSDGETGDVTERWRESLGRVRSQGFSVGLLTPGRRTLAAFLEAAAHDPSIAPTNDLLEALQNLVYDPPVLDEAALQAVRQISAPVFNAEGQVALSLTAYGFSRPDGGAMSYIDRVRAAGEASTKAVGGAAPEGE